MAELFNPFPGLRSFRPDEKYLFFGRETHTAEVLQRLRQNRFLAVVGTSGSGKSSLVTAGLLPELHGGTMVQAGSSWEVAVMRPGGDPMTNLAKALVDADLYGSDQGDVISEIRATLNRSRLGLVEAARQSDLPDGTNLLVVVDQFEELFRFRRGGVPHQIEEAAAFVQRLLEATQQESQAIYVVLTMRSDYLGDCSEFPGLAEAVNKSEYLIPRMNREQRRSAIEGPVRVGGGEIARRLMQAILNDVGDNPDQLPILQHALMRTWACWASDHAEGEPIDLRHYDQVGGIHEALSHHADEIFEQLPDDRHRLVAEKFFKALTEKGSDNRGIRRPTRMDQLASIAGASDSETAAVVEAYRQPGVTFLMPGRDHELLPETVIDISHESLMRVWQRLHGWVAEEAQSAQIYRRLAETARLHALGKAGLYRSPDLEIVRDWWEQASPNDEWASRYHADFDEAAAFLNESSRSADQARQELEAQRQHELKQAQELAEVQRLRAEDQEQQKRGLRKMIYKLLLAACIPPILIWANGLYSGRVAERSLKSLIASTAASGLRSAHDEIDRLILNRAANWQAFGRSALVQNTLANSNAEFSQLPDIEQLMHERDKNWLDAESSQSEALVAEVLSTPLSRDLRGTISKLNEISEYPVFGEVIVTNAYGAIVAATRRESDYRQDDEQWWQVAREDGTYLGDVQIDASAGIYSIDICTRIDDEQGNLLGVMSAVMNIRGIFEIVDAHASNLGARSRLALLTREGRIIRVGNTETEPLGDGSHFLLDAEHPEEPFTSVLRVDPQSGLEMMTLLARSRPSTMTEALGWILVRQVPSDEILAPVAMQRRRIFLIAVVAGFVCLAIVGWIALPFVRSGRKPKSDDPIG